jgi:hypothetical protein
MTEIEWAEDIKSKINKFLIGTNIIADTRKKLIYANEIVQYDNNNQPIYNSMAFETDILILENLKEGGWKPRVIIETKVEAVTTHDVMTYSHKAKSHKTIHPYLRYGIFIGNLGNTHIPGRLIRHGEYFDFMISWEGYESNGNELEVLMDVINSEIKSSQALDDLVFNTRLKSRQKISLLHRPLVTEEV